jgi:cobyrinic acid a,c-diamide synthase
MMGEDGVCDTFLRACEGADIAVIEGVMGMYDGIDGTDLASTAHVAKVLFAPVILVVDAGGMSRSASALISGFAAFDPGIRIAGVILNKVSSFRHRQQIEPSLDVMAFGWIPKTNEITVKSRHLGLEMAHETVALATAGELIAEHCDIGAIVRAAHEAPPFRKYVEKAAGSSFKACIGVAYDAAFCFYYQDNLDRLRHAGADLVFLSPLSDPLPDVSGLYIGGGYPELHLEKLEASPCTPGIRKAIDDGMPVYGECGGLIYLTKGLTTERFYPLCGVLPAITGMTPKIQALGYVKGQGVAGAPVLPDHLPILGHEFHYSSVMPESDARYAFRLERGRGICDGDDGLYVHNAIGTYAHAYFSSKFAESFVGHAGQYRKE